MPDLSRFLSDAKAALPIHMDRIKQIWDKLNTPLQPSSSDDMIERILADETTPLNLAANFVPPLAAAKRFKHIPKMLADKFGEIQDMYKLSGGDMPVYHGSKSIIGREPPTDALRGIPEDDHIDFKKAYRAERPTVPDLRTVELDTPVYNDIAHKLQQVDHRLLDLSLHSLPTENDLYNRLKKSRSKLEEALEKNETRTLFQYLDPAAAAEFGPFVTESVMDLSKHGYSPWDIKGKMPESSKLYKQDLFEANPDKQGMIMDPLQYTDPAVRAKPAYSGTPTEDLIPQIMTWDPNTKRSFRALYHDPSMVDPQDWGLFMSRPPGDQISNVPRQMRVYDDFYKKLLEFDQTDPSDIGITLKDYHQTVNPSPITRDPYFRRLARR